MTARSMMLLGATMAVAALAVGCGSDSDGADSGSNATSVTASSLAKPAYIKKANAICERERQQFVNSTVSLPKAVKAVYVPTFESLIEDVRALGAPSGDEAEIEAFLAAMQEDTESLEAKAATIKRLPEVEEQFKGSAASAKKYGLSRCTFYARFSTS